MSYMDRLPEDVINYIYGFVDYKRKRPHYLSEYEEVVTDWYNKWYAVDGIVYRSFKQINLSSFEVDFLYNGFKKYLHDTTLYYMIFSSFVGEFKRVARKRKNEIKID